MELISENIHYQSEHFNKVYQLYQEAFPEDERRSLPQLINCFNNTKYKLTGFWHFNNFVGFIEYWHFDSFIFVEHMAVSEKLRGKSIGKNMMQTITNKNIPVYLEIELVTNETSKRRYNFYLKIGFEIIKINYYQPAYDKNKKPIKMHILTNQKLQNKEIEQAILQILKTVY